MHKVNSISTYNSFIIKYPNKKRYKELAANGILQREIDNYLLKLYDSLKVDKLEGLENHIELEKLKDYNTLGLIGNKGLSFGFDGTPNIEGWLGISKTNLDISPATNGGSFAEFFPNSQIPQYQFYLLSHYPLGKISILNKNIVLTFYSDPKNELSLSWGNVELPIGTSNSSVMRNIGSKTNTWDVLSYYSGRGIITIEENSSGRKYIYFFR